MPGLTFVVIRTGAERGEKRPRAPRVTRWAGLGFVLTDHCGSRSAFVPSSLPGNTIVGLTLTNCTRRAYGRHSDSCSIYVIEAWRGQANERRGYIKCTNVCLCEMLQISVNSGKVYRSSSRSHEQLKLASHSQEWSISNFSCCLTRNITSHSMENLAFPILLRWKDDYYQFSLPHLYN